MKSVKKRARAGDLVDNICTEVGITNRASPRSIALHKTEAISILTYIRELRKRVDALKGESSGKSN
jgi:hypothetical protein